MLFSGGGSGEGRALPECWAPPEGWAPPQAWQGGGGVFHAVSCRGSGEPSGLPVGSLFSSKRRRPSAVAGDGEEALEVRGGSEGRELV